MNLNISNRQTNLRNRRSFLRVIPQAATSLGVFSLLHNLSSGDNFILSAREYGPPTWPSFEKVQGRLEQWQRQHPRLLKLEVLGKTMQGRPLFAAILTDPEVSNETKEHILITAQHSGVERSGTTTALHTMRWLLSGEPLAREILRRQTVICMPVVNPDGYVAGKHENAQGKDPHYAWTVEGPREPGKVPEAVAVQKMMDEFQPEVLLDCHGHDMAIREYFMYEDTRASYHQGIVRLMDETALTEGYPIGHTEDAERMAGGWEPGANLQKTDSANPKLRPQHYSYNRYHTLGVDTHSSCERSGFLRHRRLLQIGNEIWPGEYYPGYPTRVISMSEAHMLTPYGQTAAQRRQSRVELWSKQLQIIHGLLDPQTAGLVLYVCATSPAAAKKWLDDGTLKGFQAKIKDHPQVEAEAILRVLKGHPNGPGQWGPEAHLELVGGGAKIEESSAIEHGLALRLRIPYAKARIMDLRVNGRPVVPSEANGFTTWVARSFTHIQINIPPEQSRKENLFVVTCEYDPVEKRTHGEEW